MRLAIMFLGIACLSACGPAEGGNGAVEDAGVTVELPPELPPQAPTPPPAAEPAAPPEKAEAPPEPEEPAPVEKADVPEPEPRETPPPAKAEEPREPEQPQPEAAPEAPPARLPLPNATIARTIDRIGYRCGSVVSAAAAERNGEGQAVYRIACSSGETYRGTNRGGRMVFRPWEGRARPR